MASIDADVKVTEELIEQYQEFLAGMATSSLSYCSHFASIKAGLFFGRFSVTKTKSSWQNLEFFDNFLEFFFRKKLEFFFKFLEFSWNSWSFPVRLFLCTNLGTKNLTT